MLSRILPRSCSALRVFVSYAHEQRIVAAEVAQALTNAGHTVFFDVDSIPGSADYIDKIHRAIDSADRFVLLASKEALTPGKFVMTELEFARQRFRSPAGKVFPVIIDPQVALSDLPVYLRSVSVMKVAGNVAAEVVGAVHKTREVGKLCKSVTAALVLTLFGTAAMAGWQYYIVPASQPADVVLIPPEHIHFRSLDDAPIPLNAAGASMKWIDSAVTVTVMPVALSHRTEPGRKARVMTETVTLTLYGKQIGFKPVHIVEITDQKCGNRWYCIKGNAGVETLEPGNSIRRETMFLPKGEDAPKWRDFVNEILKRPELPISVRYEANVESTTINGPVTRTVSVDCKIDTSRLSKQIMDQGYVVAEDIKPVFLEPDCNPVKPPETEEKTNN